MGKWCSEATCMFPFFYMSILYGCEYGLPKHFISLIESFVNAWGFPKAYVKMTMLRSKDFYLISLAQYIQERK